MNVVWVLMLVYHAVPAAPIAVFEDEAACKAVVENYKLADERNPEFALACLDIDKDKIPTLPPSGESAPSEPEHSGEIDS